jgi:S1-C subfamily serine protease
MKWMLCLLAITAGCGPKREPATPAQPTAAVATAAPGPLHRAELVATIDGGLGQILSRSDVAPVVRDGAFVGFAVVRFDQASDLARVGLEPGDVLTAVGGKPIRTPDEAQAAFEGLRTAPSIVIDVERAGAKKTLTTPIVP